MEKKIIQQDDITIMSNNPDADLKLFSRAIRGFYRPKVLLSLRRMMKIVKLIQGLATNYPEFENFDIWVNKLNKIRSMEV